MLAANGGKFDDVEMEREFAMYLDHMRQEMKASGETEEIDEMEARQYFMVMRKQFQAMAESMSDSELQEMISKGDMDNVKSAEPSIPTLARGREPPRKKFSEIMNEIKDEWGEDGDEIEIDEWSDVDEMDEDSEETVYLGMEGRAVPAQPAQEPSWSKALPEHRSGLSAEETDVVTKTIQGASMAEQFEVQEHFAPSKYSVSTTDRELDVAFDDVELEELRELLPGLPNSRLRRVRQAYQQTLSDPSLLTLVPILRETMPVSGGSSVLFRLRQLVLSSYDFGLPMF